MAALAFGVPVLATLNHVATLDLFNYVGTCAAFGFLVPYVLITVAAPVYLKSLGQAQDAVDMAGSAAPRCCCWRFPPSARSIPCRPRR